MPGNSVVIRDTTLREGLDVPGINFSLDEKIKIILCLKKLGIKEIEIGQPNRIIESYAIYEKIKKIDKSFVASGLIFGFGDFEKELKKARFLDRIDILMPLLLRGPRGNKKIRSLIDCINVAKVLLYKDIGVGFPHATSVDLAFLVDISRAAYEAGATRIIIYDTNGKANSNDISKIVRRLRDICPIHIHCHNDRGLALSNSVSAIEAAANYVDATFNGIGDRAGNTALEPLVINLELEGLRHNINLKYLKKASDIVSNITKLRNPLFPITGDFSFYHSAKTHLERPELFEAFPPGLIGAKRRISVNSKIGNNDEADILFNIIKQRRSIRDFKPTAIKKSILRKIIKSACFAPSSMDGQPWYFIIIDDKKVIKDIVRIKNDRCPKEKKIFSADFLLKAPILIVVCVDKTKSFDREIENAVLATSHIMLMASVYGLGTTYLSAFRLNDPGLEKEMKEILRLPENVMPVTILPLGVIAEKAKMRRNIDMDRIMHKNCFSAKG